MSRGSRVGVLSAYRDGVTVICELAAQVTEEGWGAQTTCPEWRVADLAGHLRCVADDLIEYLDDAPASRLARLTEAGLVERAAYREPGARERHEYRLSEPGRELMPVLVAFMAWGDRHLAGPEGPPAVVRHADCGGRIRVSLTCEEGHELGERPRLRVEPGPGSRVR